MHSEPIHSDTRTVLDETNSNGGRGRKLAERAVDEVRRFVVMFLYLWVLFGLFALHQMIILHQEGMNFTTQGFALVNALVLAKVMLIAEDLRIGHWLRSRPLIYPILGESLIFTVVFICFHVVEHLVIGLFKGETLRESVPVIGGGGLAGLLSVAMIFFVALIPFFAFRNLSRELGADRLKGLLFGTGIKSEHGRESHGHQSVFRRNPNRPDQRGETKGRDCLSGRA